MNEEHYQTLGSPPLEPAEADFKLQTASGALMPGMGFLTCDMQIGSEYYKQQFIICKQNHIRLRFSCLKSIRNYLGT